MDQQLSAKFQQTLKELSDKRNREGRKSYKELSGKKFRQPHLELKSTVDIAVENMRLLVEELIDIAKTHQELRQIPYSTIELKEIETSIIQSLEIHVQLGSKGIKRFIDIENVNDPSLARISINQLGCAKTECISLVRTLLGDLKFYKPPISPEIVINIVNNINIDMDALLTEMIDKVVTSNNVSGTDKTKFKKMLETLRKSSMIKEIGKSVIQETIRFAAKNVIGL